MNRRPRLSTAFVCSVLGILCLSGLANMAHAQAPVVSDLAPLGLQPGQSVNLTVIGGSLDGATAAWIDCCGMVSPATDVENNTKDAAKCTFAVSVPPDAPLGVHGIRVVTGRGVSPLRPILIDDLPTTAEAGGNGSMESPQVITVPCAVDGHVDNLARDYYRFKAEAGQKLSFEIWGRRLGSPLDPVIFLYRADGRELNFSDDAEGLSGDPQLVHTFDVTGEYVLEVRDIQYRGGPQHYYRLRIGDFPCVNVALPSAVQAGVPTRVDFAGVDVADATPDNVNLPGDFSGQAVSVKTRRSSGTYHAFATVVVNQREEFLEREPNNTTEQANRVTLGASLSGRFDKSQDVDRYMVSAAKGDSFVFSGETRQVGSPTDLVIRVLKPDGGQLATVDDTGTEEGTLTVGFPEAGDYVIELSDLHGRGGSQYAYRVDVQRADTSLTLNASADVLNVPAGGVAGVTVTASRGNHGGIELSLSDVPPGVTVHPCVIGPGMTSAVLTVEAAADASAGLLTPLQVIGRTTVGDQPLAAAANTRGVLRGAWNNTTLVPATLQNSLAAAISPSGKLRLSVEPLAVSVKREQKVQVTIKAARGEGIDEAITLATNPEKNALPKGITFELKAIDKGTQEVVLELGASKDAALGRFSVALSATHKKGNDTTTASVPTLVYEVVE